MVTAGAGTRRAPVQARSRQRVEAILAATERLVLERGVEPLTTRDIADAAGVPVASLYQYFADKDAVLLALGAQQMAEMDDQVARDLRALDSLTVATVIDTAMRAFVAVYARRPAFVELYLRGRTNAALHAFGREHNARIADTLLGLAREAGLVEKSLTRRQAELAVEVGDRVFQLAYEHDAAGDPALVEEGIALVTAYLERFATPAGLGRGA